MFLVYGGEMKRELKVSCYTDVGYLTDADDMKSQTGYVFILNRAKYHGVTKGARHFRAKVHYLRETIEMADVKIEKVDTDDNLADPFTKALAFPKHYELTEKIGMGCILDTPPSIIYFWIPVIASTTLVVNKEFVPPIDMCRKIPWDLSIINQIIAWPYPKDVANYPYICKPATPTPKQCTQPKRPRNAAWFKEKAMLAEAQESGQILDEEQLAFLADLGIPDGQATQTTIPNTAAFQTENLDAYDSDCNDVSNTKAVLMANLSNYGFEVILEVPHYEPYHTDMDNQNFGKRFVPQQELSDEQAFWLQTSHPNADQSTSSPVKIKAPKKKHIKSMRENDKEEKVKHEMDKIETINVKLEQSVAKLLFENERLHKESEHLKKIYKDQFDLIKKTRALSKEHCDSLIAQLNSKSRENADLNGQIQEKVFVTTTLQRIKGKHVLDNATTITNATTIAPGMFKLDIEPLSHRLKKNRDAHEDYPKKNIKNTDTIRGLVKKARKHNPSEPLLDSACVDLLPGSRDINLYTIPLDDMLKTSSICLLSKASKTKSWLWHRRLSHLNFGTLNKLAKDGLARGIPKLKFQKDRLCSACAFEKSKKSSHQPKAKDTNQEKLYHLHMDLCGPMRVESINGKSISCSDVVPRAIDIADLPVSTLIDQDAPSTSIPSTQEQVHSLISSQGVKESPKTSHFHDDPLPESLHEYSTSQGSSYNVRPTYTLFELICRWTKDHLIANVIGDPSRSVSMRKDLATDAMWCGRGLPALFFY
nr:retrovirus-related Pol polyprotein from transposon TNT 1-94 [Tanacetum cinerariifolium]